MSEREKTLYGLAERAATNTTELKWMAIVGFWAVTSIQCAICSRLADLAEAVLGVTK